MPDMKKIHRPKMFVLKELSNRVEGNFNLQHHQLSSMMHTTEADFIFLPISGFLEMITFFETTGYKFLQVFIGSYDAGSDVADSDKNRLTLLFGISDSRKTDAKFPLYAIYRDGHFGPDPNSMRWIEEYKNRKLPLLSSNLVRNPKENCCDDKLPMTNTRRISYEKELIDDLYRAIKEIDPLKSISGFQATFSSYSFRGKPEENTCMLVNRIFVVFEFTTRVDNKDVVFYLEDIPEVSERNNSTIENLDPDQIKGVDNGHLCPPC